MYNFGVDAQTIEVKSPATGASVGQVRVDGPEAVHAACLRAKAAGLAWRALGVKERARLLRGLARRMARDEKLLHTLCAETGKPRFEAEFIEVLYTAELMRFFTGRKGQRALRDEKRSHLFFSQKQSLVRRIPYGVVGVIGPFNWPLLCNFADAVAPLIAGNTVVVKPSPLTPLTSQRMVELWKEADLPSDVFQVVNGGRICGEALLDEVDMVFFTGGNEAGAKVAAHAGKRLIPVVLEMGGKNPFLVLPDADLDQAVHGALWGGFVRSGEACVGTELLFVPEDRGDEFVEKLGKRISELRVGPPATSGQNDEHDADMGPLINPAQPDKLRAWIADAVEKGATEITPDTKTRGQGPLFVSPTIMDGVTLDMAIANHESFGPVVGVVRYKTVDEALELISKLPGGLAAAVYGRNESRAMDVARQLNAGSVCINDTLVHYFCVEAPLGGSHGSGLGTRHGVEGLRQFTWAQTIVRDRWYFRPIANLVKNMLPLPHQARTARLLRWVVRMFY